MSYFYDNVAIQEKAKKYHLKKRNMMYVLEVCIGLVVLGIILADYLDNNDFGLKWWVSVLIVAGIVGLPFLITRMGYNRKMMVFEGKVKQFAFVGSKYTFYPYMVMYPEVSDVKVYQGPFVGAGQRRRLRKILREYYPEQQVAKFEGMIYPEREDKSEVIPGFCHVCGKINKDLPEVCTECGCELIQGSIE